MPAEEKSKVKILYSYNLTDMPSSKKVRFVYLMKGRKGEKGIIERFGGEYISQSVFTLPEPKDKELIEIMGMWGVQYTRQRIMLIN